jgi:catechol 2,3-dioxygenase-like lactoylglutathione lyase family enzyme
MIKYMGPLIFVENIPRSRHFYEHLLVQQVKYDFGVNITYHGDFSIHLKDHIQPLLGDPSRYPILNKANNGELNFEADEMDALYNRLKEDSVEFIHGLIEQPWGQLVMRCYDPDGHILEIGEQMEITVWRLYKQGLSPQEICNKTAMPMEFIEQAIKERE